jgi:protein arginine kinase activator
MKCHFCDADATVHLTDIVGKKKRETHLCADCARERNLLPEQPGPQLNLQALLQLLMTAPATEAEPTTAAKPDPSALICPDCGLTYPKFRADGRLGCPADYDAFRSELETLLEKAHRGLLHAGKVPARHRNGRDAEQAVAAEQYELAARLRDEIRAKEATA